MLACEMHAECITMAKSRILIIGATGYIGPYLARASIAAGHPTFVLVRPQSASDPAKYHLIESFKAAGIVILLGSLEDYGSILDAVRQVDVVISAVGGQQLLDQLKIVSAIKEVGSIKRFVPSDFGSNLVKFEELLGPLKTAFGPKEVIRRAIEEEGIPYTYMITYAFAGFFLANLGQLDCRTPVRDKVVIYGDGNTKAIFVTEEDIATYTILAVDDPRAENKFVHIRLSANILSQKEVVMLWEQKIGKSLDKTFMPGADLLKRMDERPYPQNISVALMHTVFVKGAHLKAKLDNESITVAELYPEVKYITVEEYLDRFV